MNNQTKKNLKQFKSYEEQIELLKSKGLICDDNAIEILKRNNYYFLINRYRDSFIIPGIKPSQFRKGSKFSEIVALYHFDRDLRSLVLKNIIIVENTIKSIISHEFSSIYGYNYLSLNSFNTLNNDPVRIKQIKQLLATIRTTIYKEQESSEYIRYYKNNYDLVPLWIVINDLSLGVTIKFYEYLKDELKEIIARYFNTSKDYLESFLNVLYYFRNLCAHNQRIFDEKCEKSILTTEYHYSLNLRFSDGKFIQGKNDIMAVLIIFKILLTNEDFNYFLNEFSLLLNVFDLNVDTISNGFLYDKMGVSPNYQLLK